MTPATVHILEAVLGVASVLLGLVCAVGTLAAIVMNSPRRAYKWLLASIFLESFGLAVLVLS
jgi:hypothetical protein